MYGLDRVTTQRRSEELLDFMQLADRPKTMVADYSHGNAEEACSRRRCDSRTAHSVFSMNLSRVWMLSRQAR